MSGEFDFSTGLPSEEMAAYLQMFLDETSEQLDALVETLLLLEDDPRHAAHLNEAFRLIHSIKGSSAMMGLDSITVLTHHLESHFEHLRSGLRTLDGPLVDLVLRCIDFLRECNRRLREGQALASAPQLLEELARLSAADGSEDRSTMHGKEGKQGGGSDAVGDLEEVPELSPAHGNATSFVEVRDASEPTLVRIDVRFDAALQLPDLKAELVLTRLAELGDLLDSLPERSALEQVGQSRSLQALLATQRAAHEIREAADVGGVDLIEIETVAADFDLSPQSASPPAPVAGRASFTVETPADVAVVETHSALPIEVRGEEIVASEGAVTDPKTKVAETVRVDIERLDHLLNLAGELVVNNARFVQIARRMGPAFKKSGVSGRARSFGEAMRRMMRSLQANQSGNGQLEDSLQQWRELEAELESLEAQSKLWEDGRRCFGQITEAIDQLTRVSDNLQRGVLDTRMVPFAPLFNRFKRTVRDISQELGKKVVLEIRGEKTELDKRMIDELGDPLVHLVRNAIDHGIEPAEVRARRGKPAVGTIRLEAAHSGNNVYVYVRDDGGGINVERVRQLVVERGLVSAEHAAQLSEAEVVEFIWHPGFSTAAAVSDISGRGVGMDIVKTRIAELNGVIQVEHASGRGTTFTIRLPLTLAIIHSLLFDLKHGVFAVPIDNVREIVSVPLDQIVSIHDRKTFEVRGEFIPLVEIDDVFEWHDVDYGHRPPRGPCPAVKRIDVVILHASGKTIGLTVDELHGGQDIVIKSLAENFDHIRGLSGASILGDGSVCLLLDVAAAIDLATNRARIGRPRPRTALAS